MQPRDLLISGAPLVLAEIGATRGSAPREAGAWMLVSPEAVAGTIGGGQLEYVAIDRARAMLRRGFAAETMDVPLGPALGQCCGGHVRLRLTPVDEALATALEARIEAEAQAEPEVIVFGAGHVGRALAAALLLLPVRARLVDQRAGELAMAAEAVATTLSPLPEAEVDAAAPGSAFVIMTHDHALDFLIADAALRRGDAAYVGMIGSETKCARFAAWRRRTGVTGDPIAGLTCPIAGPSGDKRPAVIAALAAAEIIGRLGAQQNAPPERAAAGKAE